MKKGGVGICSPWFQYTYWNSTNEPSVVYVSKQASSVMVVEDLTNPQNYATPPRCSKMDLKKIISDCPLIFPEQESVTFRGE